MLREKKDVRPVVKAIQNHGPVRPIRPKFDKSVGGSVTLSGTICWVKSKSETRPRGLLRWSTVDEMGNSACGFPWYACFRFVCSCRCGGPRQEFLVVDVSIRRRCYEAGVERATTVCSRVTWCGSGDEPSQEHGTEVNAVG